jgi:arylsulfatase A-like enzyme
MNANTADQKESRRRLGLALLLVATLVLGAAGCGEPPEEPGKLPNILLISIDTLRPDRLSAYGHERRTSPNIDSLFRRGVTFDNAFSHSPKTAISHMSIFTGLLPEAHGVRQFGAPGSTRLSEGLPTLPVLLKQAGYKTAAITGGGHMSAQLGFDKGMDSFEKIEWLPDMAARAIRTVDTLSPGEDPFFLFLHTYTVHDPYTPKEPYRSLYTDPDYAGNIISDRAELEKRAGKGWTPQHDLYWEVVDGKDPKDIQHLFDLYDGSIRFVDQVLGSFLTQLEMRGLLDGMLVVVLSDHGEQFGEHEEFLHGKLYQEILHVPLAFVPPASDASIPRNARVADRVQLIDVAPTLLEYLELPAPEHLQGRSLLSLLRGSPDPLPEPAIVSAWPRLGRAALRKDNWKLVRERRATDTTIELYDLATDPAELENLFDVNPDQAASLGSDLDLSVKESRIIRRESGKGAPVALDEETQSRLEQLGYIK